MACSQRIVVAESRRLPMGAITNGPPLPVLLVAGAIALLATSCGSALGGSTPCSAYLSMDRSDQRSTITTALQQWGVSNPSSEDVSASQRSASSYCSDPIPGTDTIDGMLDSRPS